MKIRKPKYEGNMEQLLPPEKEDELIQDLLSLLEELNWSIAYKVSTDGKDRIEGIVVGGTDFVNNTLSALDGKNNIDINEMFVGNAGDLN